MTSRRLGQWVFNALAALSLSLGIIAFAAWGVGGRAGHTWHFVFDSGRPGVASTQHNWEINLSGDMGFSWFTNQTTRWTFHRVVIPYWVIVGMLAVVPVLWARNRPPRRRARPGCCARCGYDLRATPGRCPECGAATAVEGAC